MKFIVDEMPYFTSDNCPFMGHNGACVIQGGAPCEHFDPPCRERNLDECPGLITLEAYLRQKEEQA